MGCLKHKLSNNTCEVEKKGDGFGWVMRGHWKLTLWSWSFFVVESQAGKKKHIFKGVCQTLMASVRNTYHLECVVFDDVLYSISSGFIQVIWCFLLLLTDSFRQPWQIVIPPNFQRDTLSFAHFMWLIHCTQQWPWLRETDNKKTTYQMYNLGWMLHSLWVRFRNWV